MTCTYENPHVEVAFVGTQSSLLVADDLAAGDGILFDSLEIGDVRNRRAQTQAYGGRGTKNDVDLGLGPHPVKLMQEMLPSGVAGTAWDISPFLECLWTKTDRAAIEINGTPSTTGFETTEGALVVGDLIAVPVLLDGLTRYEVRKVTAVVNDSGVKDTITYAPATSAAAVNTAEIPACDKFTLRACLDADKYVTVAKAGNIVMEQLAGVCPTKLTLAMAKERVDWTVEGLGRHYTKAGATTLDTGMNDSVLEMIVDDANLFTGVSTNSPVYLTIAAEGVNTAEVVKATAYVNSTRTLTIVRAQKSTSASAHGVGAVITPYLSSLTPTLTSQAISGVTGQFAINNVLMEARSVTLTDDEKIMPLETFGDEEISRYVAEAQRRELTISAELFASITAYIAAGFGNEIGTTSCWFSVGSEAGKMAYASLPTVQFSPPEKLAEGGDSIVFTLDGAARDAGANAEMTFYLG